MQFCFQYPSRAIKHWSTWLGRGSLGELAAAAEEAGFDLVSTTDHPFPAANWLDNGGHHAFDPFVALSFMAAATTRVRLLTFILVAGYRHPYLTAKATSSLDRLSGGRLVVGTGVGYQQAEFEVLGASFKDRGKRLDAAVPALRAAWTGKVVDRDDPYFPASGHAMLPTPAQPDGPPIWFGGNGPAAHRRVAEIGDGWIPIGQTDTMAEITGTPTVGAAEQLAAQIEDIRSRRVDLGRSAQFDVCFAPLSHGGVEAHAERIAASVDTYQQAGVTHMVVEARARSYDDCLAELELYSKLIAEKSPA